MQSSFLQRATLLIICSSFMHGQHPQAKELLARAVHLADLYNWADAAPAFTEAERLFISEGDQRNALYARLGRIRSNVERDQQTLPAVAVALAEELDENPLLQNDKELRMFCLIVKGDIDTEINTGAMKRDWEQVQALARDLDNSKWQYRALAPLGIAAFYDADLTTAGKDVGAALAAATKAGDAGAQIRFLTIFANGLLQSKMYEQALAYIDNAITIARGVPDSGYQFLGQELRIEVLIGLGQLDTAEKVLQEVLTRARATRRTVHEATALGLAANVAEARHNGRAALSALEQAAVLGEGAGLSRLLASVYAQAADIHRQDGNLEQAERFAESASAATQASGDLWAVPLRLQTLAEIQVARRRYREADRVYDRAEIFLDSMIGHASSALEKTAVIAASSQIYSEHFALIADQFGDPPRAYAIIEQVRGRALSDLLAAGLATPSKAKSVERAVSQLRLRLMAARSADEVRGLRERIFLAEQARWIAPGANVLKVKVHERLGIDQIQRVLPPSAVLLEYVLADPASYCLTISRTGSRILRLSSKTHIEALVASYLKAVKAKASAVSESRNLYDALLGPIRGNAQKSMIIVVRDGKLHLVPFGGLRDPSGRYVTESRTVIYSPSATGFYLLTQQERPVIARKTLLAVGGVPYARSPMVRSGLTRGFNGHGFEDLPSSADEVRIAQSAFAGEKVDVLLGASATEAAFKAADLAQYRIIHLAVHGFADSTFPDRAALVLLSNSSAGEDGFLQAAEIVQLHFNADLVVLSACDTAVGPLQGQEGIANLSRAFLLAGARTVVSTLWQVNDSSSLYLMKRFYAHLSANQSAASALTAAQRDLLRTFGRASPPYQWAGFTVEGAAGGPLLLKRSGQ